MAEMGPPRIARMQQAGGRLKVLHPHVGGGGIPRAIHAGGEGGGGGGRGGGGGLARSFGGGGETRENGDPAVNGNFERDATVRLYGFPIAGGGLSERGKEQQALNGRLQQYNQQVQTMTQQGATFQEAFRSLARSNPEALNDLMAHPTALQSMEHLTQILQGSPSGPAYGAVDKSGQQISYDPNTGKALGAEKVPGYDTGKEEGTGTGKTFSQTYTKPDGTQGTRQMQYVRGQDGLLQAAPVEGSEGAVKAGKPAASNGFTDSDIGAGPQAPGKRPDGKPPVWDNQTMKFVRAVPGAMDALDTIQKLAPQVAGLGRSLVSIGSGKYLGQNPAGAQMAQAYSTLNALSTELSGRGYKAPMLNWEQLAGNPAMAPSAINTYAMGMKKTIRDVGQSDVDQATQRAGERIPLPQAQTLMKAGIFPNGYQSSEYTQSPQFGEQGSWWQARRFPQSLTDAQKGSLIDQAASMGPNAAARKQALGDEDYNLVRGVAQNTVQKATAVKAQTASAAAAESAQQPPAQSGSKVPERLQHLPGSEDAQPAAPAGAQAPEGPAGAPQQPGQQQATPAAPQGPPGPPQPAPGAQVPQPGASGETQVLPDVSVSANSPFASAPGELAPGMPTSQGLIPRAPPPPIPTQITTATGAPPAPSVQPSMEQQTQAAREQQALQAQQAQAAAAAAQQQAPAGGE